MLDHIFNISPVDSRYMELTEEIRNYFSEYHLIKNRIIVEIKWLKKLFEIRKMDVTEQELKILDMIITDFDLTQANRVKEIEETTKHDVKAVEYYLNEKFKENNIEKYNHLIHFACTSEDINNLAYGMMVKQLVEDCYITNAEKLIQIIKQKANEYAGIPMLSHTHGQNATPTTVGKEFAIFAFRLGKFLDKIKNEKISGKFNGTVGNFNAHTICYPDIDWIKISEEFVESFGLECNLFTTQIESHDTICSLFSQMRLFNNVLLDFNNDMWMYISRNYFIQSNVKGEVGSSVMPHKINPINFENSMANVKMANGVFDVFTQNLQISRMQRDLSDSSLLRNIGIAFAYTIIAIKQTIKGICKLNVNEEFLRNELNNVPEVLAEAIQTVLRKNGCDNAYEILKGLTRGKNISIDELKNFIYGLDIETTDKNTLLSLEPQNYVGLAKKLVLKLSDMNKAK